MRVGRKGSREESSDHSDTCQSLPRALPSKVIQTTIKHNYRNLTSIPVVPHCQHIKHLYLSHNRITSLQGIQHYPSLSSLNLSYNCLTKISQLKLIPHPQNIDKISLRMNQFEFGYEDYTVAVLPNLRKLQGRDLPDEAGKENLKRMKQYVGKQLLEFYKRTNLIIRQMEWHHDKENRDINSLRASENKKNKIVTQFMDGVFFMKLKDSYFYPTSESLRQKNASFLINICFYYTKILNNTQVYSCQRQKRREDSFLRETNEAFSQISRSILLKFASRNDKTLKKYLQPLTGEGQSMIDAFAKLGKFQWDPTIKDSHKLSGEGVKVPSIDTMPAKYMERLDSKALLNHPMNRMANWKQPEYSTLIPFEDTKWHHFYQSQSSHEQTTSLFEQVPIFLYCKQYLQVVTELILQQISKILSLQHTIINTKSEAERLSQEIQLNLSNSDIMSFGHKQQDQLDDSLDQHKGQRMQAQKETIYYSTANDTNNKHASLIHQKNKIGQDNQEQNIPYNIDKYSIYQINLIFKAFRSLKIRIKKKKLSK